MDENMHGIGVILTDPSRPKRHDRTHVVLIGLRYMSVDQGSLDLTLLEQREPVLVVSYSR